MTASVYLCYVTWSVSVPEHTFTDLYTRHLHATSHPFSPDNLPPESRPESRFFSVKAPQISLQRYVRRFVRHSGCGPPVFVAALILLNRIAKKGPFLALNNFNVHRLLTTALLVAARLLDERRYSLPHFAKVGGIPSPAELATLETTFLQHIDSAIWISEEEFWGTARCLHAFRGSAHVLCCCDNTNSLQLEYVQDTATP